MAFLLAAFGSVEDVDWTGLVRDVKADRHSNVSDWQGNEATVRLGTVSTTLAGRAPVCVTPDGVTAAVGRVEGNEDSADAVLDAYRRAGAAGLAGLRGQYAFALWDPRARSLFVGCDAIGLMAPAYSWNGRTFLLSTRAVALLRRPGSVSAFDPLYLAHALGGIWSRPAASTAFQSVRRMLGGTLIRVYEHGFEQLAGARLTFRGSPNLKDERVIRELGEILDAAVNLEGREEPSCVALSGGVDSCVVATALAKKQRELDAFSLVAPDGSPGDALALAPLIAAFPGIRHHRVLLTGDVLDLLGSGSVPDDPMCSGPVLQPGRAALLHAVRDQGFRRVFDGEGGDELFAMARRPGDLIREGAVRLVLYALASHAYRRTLLRDFLAGGRSAASNVLLERTRMRLCARRPWLRPAFWESHSFASAWEECVSFARLRNAPERLPELLGAHGRYWRTQELVRFSTGVGGTSPFLHQSVVELVGSVHASAAMDLANGKALLRRLAARRVPPAIAWRPKNEPLSDWLIARWISQDGNITRLVGRIKNSRILAEFVDGAAVAASVDQARRMPSPNWLASAIVELGALVEWVTAVETQYGLS